MLKPASYTRAHNIRVGFEGSRRVLATRWGSQSAFAITHCEGRRVICKRLQERATSTTQSRAIRKETRNYGDEASTKLPSSRAAVADQNRRDEDIETDAEARHVIHKVLAPQ